MTLKIRLDKRAKGYVVVRFDIHINGKRFSEFPGFRFKEKPSTPFEREEKRIMIKNANILSTTRKMELLQGKYGIENEYSTDVDFVDYAKRFIENHPVKDKRKYGFVVKKLTGFAKKERLLCCEMTPSFMEKFAQFLELTMRGEAASNYWCKLKQIITAATKDLHFRANPTISIKVKKSIYVHKEVLEYEELGLLANTPLSNIDVKNAFLFCCFVGLRHCDVKVLKWDNVKSDRVNVVQSKTKVPVNIPLTDDAKRFLPPIGKPNELVFNLPSHAGCQKHLKTWMKNAGIDKHISWHCSRHTLGSNLISSGVDISICAKLLGHTSVVHTQRYVKISDQTKALAMEKLPKLNNTKSVQNF